MAVVTGARNFVRLFGSTIALALCAVIVNNTLRSAVRPLGPTPAQTASLVDDPAAYPSKWSLLDADRAVVIAGCMKGFRGVFYLCTACVLSAFFAAVGMVGQHNLDRADDKPLKEKNKQRLRQEKIEKWGRPDLEAGISTDSEGTKV